MSTRRTTTSKTEAELEARIDAAIKVAFPWLPSEAIEHQINFSFQLGRKTLEVNASTPSKSEARLDILLKKDGKPFAVLELKRENLSLTKDDEAQGVSYARLVQPMAPLVVVTNGSEVRLLETHTGEIWSPTTRSEETFKALLVQASNVARTDLRFAIETLMGTTSSVWMQAVQHVTEDTIEDLTATLGQPAAPFITDFLLPRKATFQLHNHLTAGEKLLVLEGAPLGGKSNVLRELCIRTKQEEGIATLYIEAGVGRGAMQALSDALSKSLNWPILPQEARDWLVRVSNHSDSRLVLAFDGLQLSDLATIKEIEDLASAFFGPALSLVVAVDESVAQQILWTSNRLTASFIGRNSKVIRVGAIDDFEFNLAREVLADRRIELMAGAHMAPEYREPWVLSAVTGAALAALEGKSPEQGISLPSVLGLKLIAHVRRRFSDAHDLRRMYRGLAKALLSDAQDNSRPPELILKMLEEGVIRRDAVKDELEPADLQWLIDHGFLRPGMHDAAGATVLVRLTELLASETAQVLADKIVALAKVDMQGAADWIAGAASNLPLGEIVAAQAIVDATFRTNGVPIGMLSTLVNMPPQREVANLKGQYSMLLPGGPMVDITFESDGKGSFVVNGQRHEFDTEGEEQVTYKNIHPWLILSHVASMPFEFDREDGPSREDPNLLLMIGTCDVPLRANRGPSLLRMLGTIELSQGISVVAPNQGIVEPITMGILDYVSTEDELKAEEWIEKAISSDSIPLLTRIQYALGVLSDFETHIKSDWARKMLKKLVVPRLGEILAELKANS